MTTAPPNLLAVRALVRKHTGLSANATGIVGDDNHDGGYHCGRNGVGLSDYSVRESPRDRAGLSDWACAFDEGYWELRVGGKLHTLRSKSIWMVAQCKAKTPDSLDIREIIYSPDGKTVKRWDRLGIRSTGDKSHLEHTHRSYFRDAVKSGKDLTALDRRYFTEIGLLAGEDDDMEQNEPLLHKVPGDPDADVGWVLADVSQAVATLFRKPTDAKVTQGLKAEPGSVVDVLLTAAKRPAVALTDADRADIAAKVIAGLPDTLADQLADRLAARLRD
jgi:hypothetical protein